MKQCDYVTCLRLRTISFTREQEPALAFAESIFGVFRSFIHRLKFVLHLIGPVMGVLRRNPFGGKQHPCKRLRYRDYVHFVKVCFSPHFLLLILLY